MRNDKFILDGHNPIPESDVLKWGKWFETADRVVQKTRVTPKVEVSTVFLGLDHNFLDKGKPVLFETMIFGGKRDQEQYRLSHLG
jgi:hypothetical protein